jgi:hypothetical protein
VLPTNISNETAKLISRADTKVSMQTLDKSRVMPQGFAEIPFGDVDSDHQTVSTLAQRFGGHSGQRDVQGRP